ncbi:MAG: hypothetical protein LBR08_05510 [Bacteroidales bacterium]|jgi:hypothetical protein|nr:hypothetical protein [Bacteroidales bacterium]
MGKDIKERIRIKQEVKLRIDKGEPKQAILEDMSQKYKERIMIVKLLENTPSIAMKKKYFRFNIGMFILLLAILAVDMVVLVKLYHPEWLQSVGSNMLIETGAYTEINFLVGFFALLNVGIDLILLVGAGFYRIETYSWIAARGLVSLLQLVVVNLYYRHATDVFTFLSLGLVAVSFLAGLFMSVKLCPPRVPKSIEVDVDENEKIKKTIYVFSD